MLFSLVGYNILHIPGVAVRIYLGKIETSLRLVMLQASAAYRSYNVCLKAKIFPLFMLCASLESWRKSQNVRRKWSGVK